MGDLPGSQWGKIKKRHRHFTHLFSKQRKADKLIKNSKKAFTASGFLKDLSLGTLQWQPQRGEEEVNREIQK